MKEPQVKDDESTAEERYVLLLLLLELLLPRQPVCKSGYYLRFTAAMTRAAAVVK